MTAPILPPPPSISNHPLTDDNNRMTRAYVNWFFNVYNILIDVASKAGGNSTFVVNTAGDSLPNAQVLASLNTGFAKVTSESGLISTQTMLAESDIVNLVNDLSVLTSSVAGKADRTNPVFIGQVVSSSGGAGYSIKEGSNCKMGTAVLNGTTAVVISNSTVTSTSRIFLTVQVSGGSVGAPYVDSRIAGTSFSIKSTNGSDSSTVAYLLFEPS